LNILDDSNVTVYYIIAVFQHVLYLCPVKRNLLKNILTGHWSILGLGVHSGLQCQKY